MHNRNTGDRSDRICGPSRECANNGGARGHCTSTAQYEHVVHLNVSWATYETLAADVDEDRRTLLSYDGTTLELMSRHTEHEAYKRLIDLLLSAVMAEWDLNLYGTGSMTLTAKPLRAEPITIASLERCGYVAPSERTRVFVIVKVVALTASPSSFPC